MSLFLKHNSNASVRLSWSHSSTHLLSQSALTSLSTCSGLSTHVLLLPVALLGLPCNRKCNCYSLFLRTASLEFGLDIFPNRLLAVPLLQWHVKPPLRALWPECLQNTTERLASSSRNCRAAASSFFISMYICFAFGSVSTSLLISCRYTSVSAVIS